jgi:two-component system CheB/CheR fusion protein
MARVLVVDDDAAIRGLVSAVLEFEGHQVLTAQDGRAALRVVDGALPDLIVLDIAMPGMNGFAFLEELYSHGLRDKTRVILASGQMDDEAIHRGKRSAVRHFLPKPFDPDELVAIVNEALSYEPGELVVKKDRLDELSRLLEVVDYVIG